MSGFPDYMEFWYGAVHKECVAKAERDALKFRVAELEAEIGTLRESLAEVNRLLSLNVTWVAELEKIALAASRVDLALRTDDDMELVEAEDALPEVLRPWRERQLIPPATRNAEEDGG